MGAKLLQYYEEAKKVSGLKGQMRMAMLTNVPSTKAASEPDSPQLIGKFSDALAQIRKEV